MTTRATREEMLMNEVKARYDWLLENYDYEVVGVFLRGSQNYELDVYSDEYMSDVDVYAFVLPTLVDLAMGRQLRNKELHYYDDSHVDVVDVRHGVELFRKANPSFLELLFTDFKYVNPKYEDLWEAFEVLKDRVAQASPKAFVSAVFGSVMQKRDALTHPYPSQVEELERHGFCSKQLHHLVRYKDVMQRYVDGVEVGHVDFKKLLVPENKDYLLRLKTDADKLTLEQALQLADEAVEESKRLRNYVLDEYQDLKRDTEVFDLLYDVVVEMLRTNLREG